MDNSKKQKQPKQPNGGGNGGGEGRLMSKMPMLRYGKDGNFGDFKRQLSIVGSQYFGRLADLVDLDDYYEPKEILPTEPRFQPFEGDTQIAASNRRRFDALVMARDKIVLKMEQERVVFYNYIWDHMSEASRDSLSRVDNHAEIRKEKDPLKLWLAIKLCKLQASCC